MSEILSEDDLSAMENRYEYRTEGWPLNMHRLIDSHRALQAERDALKAQLDQRAKDYKQLIADQCEEDTEFREQAGADDHSSSYGMEPYVEILKRVQQERDALKAELAEAAAIAEEIGPLVYDELYLQVRNSQEAKEFMLRDPRFQKAARFLEKREAQP